MHAIERMCGPRRCELLIVDDEQPILDLLGETVRDEGFQVTLVPDLPAALAALERTSFDLILADALAAFTAGFAIDQWSALEAIRDHAGGAGVIIFSAHPAHQFEGWRERGFRDFIAKPFDLDALLATLRHHLATGRQGYEAAPWEVVPL